MAFLTPHTSASIATYTDKTIDWLIARLEYLAEAESRSVSGSILRRKEIRFLRVEIKLRLALLTPPVPDLPPAPLAAVLGSRPAAG